MLGVALETYAFQADNKFHIQMEADLEADVLLKSKIGRDDDVSQDPKNDKTKKELFACEYYVDSLNRYHLSQLVFLGVEFIIILLTLTYIPILKRKRNAGKYLYMVNGRSWKYQIGGS
jgi:hypothetical protein